MWYLLARIAICGIGTGSREDEGKVRPSTQVGNGTLWLCMMPREGINMDVVGICIGINKKIDSW